MLQNSSVHYNCYVSNYQGIHSVDMFISKLFLVHFLLYSIQLLCFKFSSYSFCLLYTSFVSCLFSFQNRVACLIHSQILRDIPQLLGSTPNLSFCTAGVLFTHQFLNHNLEKFYFQNYIISDAAYSEMQSLNGPLNETCSTRNCHFHRLMEIMRNYKCCTSLKQTFFSSAKLR